MIKEDYVNFEMSKLLEEKGYEGDFDGYYNNAGYEISRPNPNLKNYHYYKRPSLYCAMKWIMEQGFYIKIDIDVDYDEDERGIKWYHKPAWDWAVFRIDERKQMSDDGALYATYEQAAEVAIKWCLENIF